MKPCYFDLESKGIVDLSPNILPGGGWVVCRVNTPYRSRGKGIARRLMAQVLADADAEGVTLWLGINPYGPMDYDQLESWYRRLGFKGPLSGTGMGRDCWPYRRLPHTKRQLT
jgi:GNAT superfamily N-acetyltransferase